MFYFNRLNLKTLQIEHKLISVKAAEAHILGVLTDGGIVFWYSLNPSENGVFNTVFSLAKEKGNWKITRVDELTDAEIGE